MKTGRRQIEVSRVLSRRQIEVPGWTLEVVKILGTVVISLALFWVKFTILANKVDEHHQSIADIKVKQETAKDVAGVQAQKTSTLEIQQTLVAGEFRDSLKRIEDDVKELKIDFKGVSRNAVAKPGTRF